MCVPSQFRPMSHGGQDWPVCLSGGRVYAAFRAVSPFRPRRGYEGERQEGFAGLGFAPVGRSTARPIGLCTMPPARPCPGSTVRCFVPDDRSTRCRRRSWPPPGSLDRLPIHRKWSQPSSAASRPTASLVAKDIRQTRVQIIGLSVEHPAPIQAQRPRSIAYVEEGRASAF